MHLSAQNTSVTAERVVDLIEESMQQLFRRGARKFAAILFQTCEYHGQAGGSLLKNLALQ